MKKHTAKIILLALSLCLLLVTLSACSPKTESPAPVEKTPIVIKVGATPVPHAEILEQIKPLLAEKNISLKIVEFTDYVLPNLALQDGDIDANFFQHVPYLNYFNESNKTNLVAIQAVHFEPLGIYPGKTASIEALQEGATIAIPNDATNEARALLLLQSLNLLTLKSDIGLTATPNDIVSNPKKLKFTELEAVYLTTALPDVDLAVINGNYALEANITDKLLACEAKDSEAAATYANVLVVKAGNEKNPELLALAEALTSDTVKTYIENTYHNTVVAVFK